MGMGRDGFDGREDGKTSENPTPIRAAGGKGGRRNARETQQKETEDFDKSETRATGKPPTRVIKPAKSMRCEDKASSIESEREGRSAPMEFREIEA